jgi:hypothetical protein
LARFVETKPWLQEAAQSGPPLVLELELELDDEVLDDELLELELAAVELELVDVLDVVVEPEVEELELAPPTPEAHRPFTQAKPAQHPVAQLWPSALHAVQTSFAHVPLQHSEKATHDCPPALHGPPLAALAVLPAPPTPVAVAALTPLLLAHAIASVIAELARRRSQVRRVIVCSLSSEIYMRPEPKSQNASAVALTPS